MATTPRKRLRTRQATGRRLSSRHTQVDPSQLPVAAQKAAKALNTAIGRYAFAQGVDDASFDDVLSRALHATLPVEGRRRRLEGDEYAVLALRSYLRPIYEALEQWEEEPARQVIEALRGRWNLMAKDKRFTLDLTLVPDWLKAHKAQGDAAEAVVHCIALDAPEEVRIEKRLAQAGAQKRVFAANWTVADDPTEIVIKEFLGKEAQILIRERRPHPLSMTHPNIIETFTLDNDALPRQTFLVERRMEVLDDEQRLSGWAEQARLLIDMARALAFLDDQGLVHGDVKPDNIGFRQGRFVLLDFGICRPAAEFLADDVAQTGSLRTRAPEILLGTDHHSARSDVWALGATMFNVLVGRFPLLDVDEKPPNPEKQKAEREAFERKLCDRIEYDWAQRLAPLKEVPDRALRGLVEEMLIAEPGGRPDAEAVLRRGLAELVSLIGIQEGPRFSASAELKELRRHLADDPEQIGLLPVRRSKDLDTRLMALGRALRAQRHYQDAADRVAGVADVERDDPLYDPGNGGRDKLERLAELARQFRTPEDQSDLDLLHSVREQLRLAEPRENTQLPVLLDVLHTALRDAKEQPHGKTLEVAAGDFERLLAKL